METKTLLDVLFFIFTLYINEKPTSLLSSNLLIIIQPNPAIYQGSKAVKYIIESLGIPPLIIQYIHSMNIIIPIFCQRVCFGSQSSLRNGHIVLSTVRVPELDCGAQGRHSRGGVVFGHRELPEGLGEWRVGAPLHGAVAALTPEADVVTRMT